VKVIFWQVPRISDTFEQCNSLTEKWVWGLKNISQMKNKSLSELKEEFKKIVELADVATLNEKDRSYYQAEEQRLRDYINTMETSLSTGYEKGVEEGVKAGMKAGMEKGMEKEKKEIAIKMKEAGISIEDISNITNLTAEEIENLG
jgi:predicted transposase/invertase (TIGR01784 family)